MTRKFYVIDGHSEIYRAYYAPFSAKLSSRDGEPTKATYLFTRMLLELVRRVDPKYLAVCMDSPRETLKRRQLYFAYKANRPPTPEDIRIQFKRCREIIKAMGIVMLREEGYEADDLIATLVRRHSCEVPMVLVSRDHDLHQLVAEGVEIYDAVAEVTWNHKDIRDPAPHQVLDFKSLVGDKGDNVPGAMGIGKKTAMQLLKEYGTLRKVMENVDEQPKGIRMKLLASMQKISLSRQLVSPMYNDSMEPSKLAAFRFRGVCWEDTLPIFKRLGFILGVRNGKG